MTVTNKALIVVTSHDKLGETDRKTGFYYDEMSLPYWALMDAGYDVDIASLKGGAAPYDSGSYGEDGTRAESVQRFLDDPASMTKIMATLKIVDVNPVDYDCVFLPGGHGTMWDFTDPVLAKVIGAAWDNNAIIGAVCHGPAGLIHAMRADGLPLVHGLRVNAFTNQEEKAVALDEIIPFFTETELRNRGGLFESTENFQAHSVRDGRLITGQNPRSAAGVAKLMLEALSER
jgi:putative intracellular protease/amidase